MSSETDVTVYEGQVELSNAEGSVQVGANQRAVAQAGQAPVTVAVVRPRDAVQWTLYYPPVFSPERAGERRCCSRRSVHWPWAASMRRVANSPKCSRRPPTTARRSRCSPSSP